MHVFHQPWTSLWESRFPLMWFMSNMAASVCVCVSLDKNYVQKWLNQVSPERDNKSWSLKNPSSLLIVSTTVQLILRKSRKSYRNIFGWLWIGRQFGGQCMSLSFSFYSNVYYNFLGCTWKSACQQGPEWGIYRVLSASFGSRHGIRQPFMSLKQLTTVFGGKQSISFVPLAFRNPKFYIRFAFYKPGPRSVLEPPSQTFVVIRIFHVGVGKLPAEGRQKPLFSISSFGYHAELNG